MKRSAACRIRLRAWPLLLMVLLGAAACERAMPQTPPPTTRQQLIGAWQLLSVQVIGPKGRRDDPFYNANPSGVLVYDPSGWMSVQIASTPRPPMEAHATRPGGPHAAQSAQQEAAVLDTYYAYAGRWDFDAATSKIIHHVTLSLIPAEVGKSYSQTAHVEGEKLTFTVQRKDLGENTVQEKVWQRIGDAPDPGR